MPILQWHDAVYALGIPAVDAQHRELVALINLAHDRAWRDEEESALREVIARMERYAVDHFATEEGIMVDHGYPDLESHRRAHREFSDRVERLRQARKDGRDTDPQEIFRFLAEWLSAHILELDAAFGQYLDARK